MASKLTFGTWWSQQWGVADKALKTINTKKKKTSYDAREKVLKKLDFFFNDAFDYDLQSILMACIFYFSAVSHRQKPISISSKLPGVVNSTVSRCMLPRWETLKNNVSNIFLPLSAECFKSVSTFVPFLGGKYLRLPLSNSWRWKNNHKRFNSTKCVPWYLDRFISITTYA